jgi:hypothetical protein
MKGKHNRNNYVWERGQQKDKGTVAEKDSLRNPRESSERHAANNKWGRKEEKDGENNGEGTRGSRMFGHNVPTNCQTEMIKSPCDIR